MPKIDDFLLPEELTAELGNLVDSLKPELVLQYARQTPNMLKGARLNKSSVLFIKKKLKNIVSGTAPLKDNLRQLLRDESLNREFICVLSELVISECLIDFMGMYGKSRFLTGMLLDDRENMRKIAIHFSENESKITLPKPDEAKQQLQNTLSWFLNHCKDITDNIGDNQDSGQTPKSKDEEDKYKQKIKELTDQLSLSKSKKKSEKKFLRKIDQLNDTNQQLKDSVSNYKQRLDKEKQINTALQQQLENTQEELQKTKSESEQHIHHGVEEGLKNSIRNWLAKPLEIENATKKIKSEDTSDILKKVEKILKQQEEIDRHNGNIHFLQEDRKSVV